MLRRHFLRYVAGAPVLGYSLFSGAKVALADGANTTPKPQVTGSLQSFGFYEPLGETDAHDPSETDGTDFNMPCITAGEIAAGVDKTYTFWHGHDGMNHMFTVTAAMFAQLQQGQSVAVCYTTMVEDHRHSLTIDVNSACNSGACRVRVTDKRRA
jgi:hypothetical protein